MSIVYKSTEDFKNGSYYKAVIAAMLAYRNK